MMPINNTMSMGMQGLQVPVRVQLREASELPNGVYAERTGAQGLYAQGNVVMTGSLAPVSGLVVNAQAGSSVDEVWNAVLQQISQAPQLGTQMQGGMMRSQLTTEAPQIVLRGTQFKGGPVRGSTLKEAGVGNGDTIVFVYDRVLRTNINTSVCLCVMM